jgi:hypothetical protein
MTCLPRHHSDLATMMSFVRHEVGQQMPDVEREIAPHVALGWRDLPSCGKAELEQRLHSAATALQCGHELARGDTMVVDAGGGGNSMLPPERLDPAAAGVVEVGSYSADRAPRGARNSDIPERRRQVLDKVDRHAVVRPPRGQQARL